MSSGADRHPRPVADVVAEDLGADICLYRATDEVLVLNRTAADVWRLCDGQSSVSEIVATLADAYRTPAATIAPDIDAVLADLIGRGYVSADATP